MILDPGGDPPALAVDEAPVRGRRLRSATPVDKAAYLDFVLEVIRRRDGVKGLEVQPRLWVVERTFGWMMRWRALVRDEERRNKVRRP
jgi:transposase